MGTGTYLGLLGLLTAGLVLQGLKKLPAPETAALVLSLLSGAAFVFAYCRLSVIRTYLSYLIPAAVLFPLLFLLDSEIRKLILPEPDSEVGIESGARTPVVMVIFDEFPLISLLNGRREIDSNLFPNLAELAENSYWFRNATTNNERTLLSIPVILSGTLPRQRPFPLPLFREYPKNLFSLLSGSHDLRIREQVTGLNPRRIPAPFGPRFQLLAEDLSVAYLHLLLPPAWASRWLPPVTQTWNQFLNPGAPGPIRRAWRDFRVDWSRRPDRFRNFVDSIRGNGSPALYFLHTMLPHASWKYLPSGKLYTLSERPGVAGVVGPNSRGLEVNQWLEDPWLVTQSYQRHLLQVTFLDRLVGELVRRLREEDLYDSTLLVLTADHGASFRPGDSRRRVTGTNYMDILSVPLIIKAPGQKQGVLSDRNVESMDIIPTLVEMLGIETEWPLDGQSALDTEAPERSEKIVYNDDGEKFSFDPRLEARWKSLDRKLALFAAANGELSEQDLYRIGPHAELVGERTDALVQGKSDLTEEVDGSHLFRQVDLDSSFLLSRISGRVDGSQGSRIGRTLAIGVNGTVGAVTRTSHLDGDTVFSALVPETSFRDGSNRIRIYETSSTGSSVALLPVEIPAPATYRLDAAGGEFLGDYMPKCREFRLMVYNSYHERPRNYPVQSQAVQGWNPAVGRGEVHPESAVQRCTGGTQDGLGIRATRRDPVRSDEGVDLQKEGGSGGARVSGGQGGAGDAGSVGPGLQGVLPSLQGGGEAGVSSIPAHCEDGDHRRRRPQSDHGEEARSGLRHPAQGLSDDPDISLPAVAGRMPVESVADCPQAEPGVCGPDLRGGEASATEMRVFGGDRPGSPQASGAVHG